MSHSISSSSSPSSGPRSAVELQIASPACVTASNLSPKSSKDTFSRSKRVKQPESEGKQAPERPENPLEAPQEWEADFAFDFTASPGADEWMMGDSAEGSAIWSTVDQTGATVKIEFQKWDW
ncbi:hypothetical protein FRB90_001652 [Tulasnella sp. 427]|nr:hypothetical protein FRB90_001652 [Tulasnella sp. 427]